jgi:hypothetical protein
VYVVELGGEHKIPVHGDAIVVVGRRYEVMGFDATVHEVVWGIRGHFRVFVEVHVSIHHHEGVDESAKTDPVHCQQPFPGDSRVLDAALVVHHLFGPCLEC